MVERVEAVLSVVHALECYASICRELFVSQELLVCLPMGFLGR